MNIIINNEINSYDANFIGQQWYKEHCDSTTHNGRSKRAKPYGFEQNTLLIENFKSSVSCCLLVLKNNRVVDRFFPLGPNIYLITITITTRQACCGFDLALIRRNRWQNRIAFIVLLLCVITAGDHSLKISYP